MTAQEFDVGNANLEEYVSLEPPVHKHYPVSYFVVLVYITSLAFLKVSVRLINMQSLLN